LDEEQFLDGVPSQYGPAEKISVSAGKRISADLQQI